MTKKRNLKKKKSKIKLGFETTLALSREKGKILNFVPSCYVWRETMAHLLLCSHLAFESCF
jgi:hypothetical protein